MGFTNEMSSINKYSELVVPNQIICITKSD